MRIAIPRGLVGPFMGAALYYNVTGQGARVLMSAGAVCVTPWVLWPLAVALLYREIKTCCAVFLKKNDSHAAVLDYINKRDREGADKALIMSELPAPEFVCKDGNVWTAKAARKTTEVKP